MAAGNDVSYTVYEGMPHTFFELETVVDQAQQAVQEATDRLGASFEAAS